MNIVFNQLTLLTWTVYSTLHGVYYLNLFFVRFTDAKNGNLRDDV